MLVLFAGVVSGFRPLLPQYPSTTTTLNNAHTSATEFFEQNPLASFAQLAMPGSPAAVVTGTGGQPALPAPAADLNSEERELLGRVLDYMQERMLAPLSTSAPHIGTTHPPRVHTVPMPGGPDIDDSEESIAGDVVDQMGLEFVEEGRRMLACSRMRVASAGTELDTIFPK